MPSRSSYQPAEIDIAGSSNQNRSEPVSVQTTQNAYVEITDPGGINRTVLHSWPLYEKSFVPNILATNRVGVDKGMHNFKGSLYQVFDDKLWRFDLSGNDLPQDTLVRVEIGAIPSYTQRRYSFDDNGDVMVIATGSTAWSYDGTTLAALPYTFNPKTVQFLNERFWFDGEDIVSLTDSRRFYVSDVNSTNVDSINSAYPRSRPDQFIMPFVFNQTVYMMCDSHIEPWVDSAAGNPPANRVNQGIIEDIGIGSIFGAAATPDAMFFISKNAIVYKLVSYQIQRISNIGVTNKFLEYDINAVHIDYLTVEGQRVIVFTFDNDNVTWYYNDTSKTWGQLNSEKIGAQTTDVDYFDYGRYVGSTFVYAYGRYFFSNPKVNVIYEYVDSLISSSNVEGRAERVMPVIVGTPGQKYRLKRIRFNLHVTKQDNLSAGGTTRGEEVIFMFSLSTDGINFGAEEHITVIAGRDEKVVLNKKLDFRNLYIKIATSANDAIWAMFDASADIKEAGNK